MDVQCEVSGDTSQEMAATDQVGRRVAMLEVHVRYMWATSPQVHGMNTYRVLKGVSRI